MKTLAITLAGIALAGATAASAASAEENEARLARMLEGRTAGAPVRCIPAFNSDQIEVIESVGIVYDSGGTIFVARPSDPQTLGRDDVLVIKRFGGQLCSNDVMHTVDRMTGFTTGVVFLEEFVPYTKQG